MWKCLAVVKRNYEHNSSNGECKKGSRNLDKFGYDNQICLSLLDYVLNCQHFFPCLLMLSYKGSRGSEQF